MKELRPLPCDSALALSLVAGVAAALLTLAPTSSQAADKMQFSEAGVMAPETYRAMRSLYPNPAPNSRMGRMAAFKLAQDALANGAHPPVKATTLTTISAKQSLAPEPRKPAGSQSAGLR